MKKLMYEAPLTDELTIRTEANFVATGGIPDGKTGNSDIEDLEEETSWDPVIWS